MSWKLKADRIRRQKLRVWDGGRVGEWEKEGRREVLGRAWGRGMIEMEEGVICEQ